MSTQQFSRKAEKFLVFTLHAMIIILITVQKGKRVPWLANQWYGELEKMKKNGFTFCSCRSCALKQGWIITSSQVRQSWDAFQEVAVYRQASMQHESNYYWPSPITCVPVNEWPRRCEVSLVIKSTRVRSGSFMQLLLLLSAFGMYHQWHLVCAQGWELLTTKRSDFNLSFNVDRDRGNWVCKKRTHSFVIRHGYLIISGLCWRSLVAVKEVLFSVGWLCWNMVTQSVSM